MIDAEFMRKHFTLVTVTDKPAPAIDPDTLDWILEALATAADMLKRDDTLDRRMVAADLACAAIELKALEVTCA